MEVIAFISFFLGASWDFFTETTVPGFNFSFAALFVGLFLASFGLRVIAAMIGVGFSSGMVLPLLPKKEVGTRNDPNYHSTSLW